ncbi:contractile injection system tape measure protein [Tateyamaria sp. syn59]|uniref:contractile injection system tape measure protein n=1 Tax=Tateyamaria sp. syn59 TaxID=2576942 RepID=UPI0011BD5CE2|nr:contractile injection system tape measure protein [Tateyamaria sp. syn59]
MGRHVHRVGCVRFQVTGPDQSAILQWRTRLDAAGADDLPAALDTALTEVSPGDDDILVIDRLVVDLGTFAPDDFDLDRLTAATQKALHRVRIDTPRDSGALGTGTDSDPETPEPGRAYRLTRGLSAQRTLMHYLATGQISQQAPFPDLATLYDAVTDNGPTAMDFRDLLLSSTRTGRLAVLLRLFATAPPNLALRLLTAAFPDPAAAIKATLSPAPRGTKNPDTGRAETLAHQIDSLLETAHPTSQNSTRKEKARDTDPNAEPYGIECDNAGLVLLHPFLSAYFTGIGLAEGRNFVSPDAQVTAARLLHAIATGDEAGEEPDLGIPRLLCAVPPDLPVLPLAPLDPDHLAEADRMLDAAIAAWKGVGHMSPAGLRETFLQRGGLLQGPEDALRLTLERRGVDILLDRLPWTLSVIKLPWMPAPLKVDWI